jgi:twitching motility protein PilT
MPIEKGIKKYFETAIRKGASDIHLVAGEKPTLRISGELMPIDSSVLNGETLKKMIYSLLAKKDIDKLEEDLELDLGFEFNKARFRINVHWQKSQIGLAARLIPSKIPAPDEITLDDTIVNLTRLSQGLVILNGPSGCGKSTTLATMIDVINNNRKLHIVTIEDPIEFVYEKKQSIIEQREIGQDTLSFANGLKYVLRQDPNVILVGEMRDLDTISSTLTAAETGHLVFSTLHTWSAPESIERIIDLYPAYRQRQVLVQLASSLRAVISQQLLPRKGGGQIAVREIMLATPAVSNLIRQNKTAQLYSVIQTSAEEGMISMENAIKQALADDLITEEVANNALNNIMKI